MAITKTQFISDVELKLNQSQISDDTPLEKSHIAFVGSYFLNALVAEECNNKLRMGEQIPSVYVTRASIEVPEAEDTDEVDEDDQRIFVEIPEAITFNKDAGIIAVHTEELDEIKKADIQTMMLFRKMRFSKPSEQNLVYYRAGNKLFIEGFKAVDIPFTFILLDYVPKQDMVSLSDDDEILCSDLIYPSVVGSTVDELKRMLYGSQPDVANDGTDVKSTSYHLGIQKGGVE